MDTCDDICVTHKPERSGFGSEVPDHKVLVTGSSSCKRICKWINWDVLRREKRRQKWHTKLFIIGAEVGTGNNIFVTFKLSLKCGILLKKLIIEQ